MYKFKDIRFTTHACLCLYILRCTDTQLTAIFLYLFKQTFTTAYHCGDPVKIFHDLELGCDPNPRLILKLNLEPNLRGLILQLEPFRFMVFISDFYNDRKNIYRTCIQSCKPTKIFQQPAYKKWWTIPKCRVSYKLLVRWP